MKRSLVHGGPEAAVARQAEEGALRTDAPQPNPQLDELLDALRIKRTKLSAGFLEAKSLIKKKTSVHNSELSKLQQDTAEEIAKLHAIFSCESNVKRHLNSRTKQTVDRILLLLRRKFDKLLVVQEESNAEAADLESQIAAILNDLSIQVTSMKQKIPEEYEQMMGLLNCQSNEKDKMTSESLKDNIDHGEDEYKILNGMDRNEKKKCQPSVSFDQPGRNIELVRGEWENEHTNNYEKHMNNIAQLGESARERERESTKQVYLAQIAQIMKRHESELSELQQKLDVMLSEQRVEHEAKLLTQVFEHDKNIEQWKVRLEQFRQQSISHRENLEKAHREEVSDLQINVHNIKQELIDLQKKATGWKTDLDQLSEDHNALKDAHSRQLFELEQTGELARNLALIERELEEQRSKEEKSASLWQKQIIQAKDDTERYQGLLNISETENEVQLTQMKQEIEHYKILLNKKESDKKEQSNQAEEKTKYNEDLKAHHSQILEQINSQHCAEIHSLKQAITAATTEANSAKMRALDGLTFRDQCIGQLQRDLQTERAKFIGVSTEMNKVLSDRNISQQEHQSQLVEMTQLRQELDRLRNENLEKTTELKVLEEKVSLDVGRIKELMDTNMETIQALESQHQQVVVRLPTDLDALKSKNRETVSKLEAEKAVLQNKIEALEEQLGQLKQLHLEDKKERHLELKLALKDLEQELSEREAFSDRIQALLSIAEDKFARSCLEVENLRQQIFDIRTTEGLTAQASSSDHGLPSDTIPLVVLPRNNGESEEDPEEQMLQHVLRECEQLEKLIGNENAELQAEEDEFRKLDAKHMALVKDYGDSFTWKAGKKKQGNTKG